MMRFVSVVITFLMIFLSPLRYCPAQKIEPSSAMEAYDYVQHKRAEAAKLWEPEHASKEDIEKGIKILEDALIYLNDPLVMDLARGNLYLRARPSNVYQDLGAAYALLGDKEKAVESLRRMFAVGVPSSVAKYLGQSKAYDSIREESGFKEIIEKLNAQERLWEAAALKTAYRENLSEDEKVAGLSLFWSEVKYNFANFDHVPEVDWDKLYLAYLPKVRATKTTLEYYTVLQEMCAQLKDGHTNVYPPQELENVYARPPLRAALIEGKILITEVRSESLRSSGIRPGMEIMSIDGLPARQYAEQRVAPYQSSSTKQDLEVRAYTYALLSGPKEQPVALELRDENGMTIKRSIARSGYTDISTPQLFEFKVLGGNIAYIILNSFESKDIIKSFDTIFEKLAQTDALILDVRANDGGSSDIGYAIIGYLTGQPFKLSRWKTRAYSPTYRAWGFKEQGWDGERVKEWQPNGKNLYDKPVALLTSARTFSAAEDFCVAFDYMKRGKIIGEPTGGSTGQPLFFALPGGGQARVCTKRDTYPDGKEFVGIGVQPDILVRPTLRGVRSNRDEVLEAAVNYAKSARRE